MCDIATVVFRSGFKLLIFYINPNKSHSIFVTASKRYPELPYMHDQLNDFFSKSKQIFVQYCILLFFFLNSNKYLHDIFSFTENCIVAYTLIYPAIC